MSRNHKIRNQELEIKSELARIAREQLEFDKAEAASEKRFWKMGAGTRVTILVSAAAVLVSLIVGGFTVWASWITKEKEIHVSSNQRKVEQEKLDTEKKREWELSLAQFVLTNQKAIFSGTPEQQRILAKIIPTIFPDEVSVTLLERLEKTSPPPSKAIWSQARVKLATPTMENVEETPREEMKQVAISKPSPVGIASSTLPSWLTNNETSRYGFPAGTEIANISLSTGDPLRSSFDARISSNSTVPQLSDLVYRPSSNPDLRNLNDLTKSISSAEPFPSLARPVISGIVIDSATGLKIPDASVELESRFAVNRISAKTDASGRFSVTVPSGIFLGIDPLQLKVVGNGYKSLTREVSISNPIGSIPISIGSIALEKTPQ